jgi:hypothetical protein
LRYAEKHGGSAIQFAVLKLGPSKKEKWSNLLANISSPQESKESLWKNPLLMYSTIRFGTASKAAPQGRHLYRAGVGVELAIKRLPAQCLDH